MRKIQTKITILIVSMILLASIMFLIIGYFYSSALMDNDVDQIIALASENTAKDFNSYFETIEESVRTIHDYAAEKIYEYPDLFTDKDEQNRYTSEIEALSTNVIRNINGVYSVYFEYNPNTMGKMTGFWLAYNNKTQSYEYAQLYDFSVYSEDDENYAAWFYEPIKKKASMWIGPYYDDVLGKNLYTYSSPLFVDGEPIGIVAMDISIDTLESVAKSVKVYMDGDVIITDSEKNILYSEIHPDGIAYDQLGTEMLNKIGDLRLDVPIEYAPSGVNVKAYYTKLRSGMYLGIHIPLSALYEWQHSLFILTAFATLCCLILATILAIRVINSIVKPLNELTRAADAVARGEMDTKIEIKSNDEVGVLAGVLSKTLDTLEANIKMLEGTARIDALTGINNKNAFQKTEEAINSSIDFRYEMFTVAVFDINDLKITNDTYGHEAGDKLIKTVADMLKTVYGERKCFRIGGDEFAGILRGCDIKTAYNYLNKLTALIDEYNNNANEDSIPRKVSVAMGVAAFNISEDKDFMDVFNRADQVMYINKKNMKGKSHSDQYKNGMTNTSEVV